MDTRLRQVVIDRELLDRARTIFAAHVADAHQRGDERAHVRALGYLGEVDRLAGRFPEAIETLEAALAILRDLDETGDGGSASVDPGSDEPLLIDDDADSSAFRMAGSSPHDYHNPSTERMRALSRTDAVQPGPALSHPS